MEKFGKVPGTEQQHVNQKILKKLDEVLEKLDILLGNKNTKKEE